MADAEKNQHDDDDIIESKQDLSGDAEKTQAGSSNKRNDRDGLMRPAHELLSDEEKRALMDFDTGGDNKINQSGKSNGEGSKADTDAIQANGQESCKESSSSNSGGDIPTFDPADHSMFQQRRIHSAGRKGPSSKAKDKAASQEMEQLSKIKPGNSIDTKGHNHLPKKSGIDTRLKAVEIGIKSGSSPKNIDSKASLPGEKEAVEEERIRVRFLSSDQVDQADEIIAQIVARDIEKLCGR